MSEWCDYKLGDIAEYVSRGISPKYVENNGIPVINQKCIRRGTISLDLIKYQNKEKKHANEKIVHNEDILINSTGVGTAGRVAIFRQAGKVFADSHISILRLNRNIAHPLFVYYNLRKRETEIEGYAEGSTGQIELSRDKIKEIDILLPPLPEQKAIAAVLSSLDDKIDLLHRQNKTLESMAETLFRQWFIEEAQEEWADTTLDCHSEVLRGLSYKGSGLSDSGLGIPMHNLNSIYEGGGYKEVGIKYYTAEFKERHLVRNGEIIVANTEQGHEFKLIGCPAIVPSFYGEKGLFSQHIYRVILKENSYLTTEYLYYLLLTPYLREQIISATNGSTVNMLAIDGLQRPKFKLPPKEKVAEFSEIVISWWKKKDLNHFQIRTLEKLRDTLLPKLMSGEVRVMS